MNETLLGVQVSAPSDAAVHPEILRYEEADLPNVTVKLDFNEFTSLCPRTKQPDFGEIRIVYKPRGRIVETKSLKLYLFGYRNVGMFQERIVQTIGDDLFFLLSPESLEVTGKFNSRGGVVIEPKYVR